MHSKSELFVYLCLACALLVTGCASSSNRSYGPLDTGYTLHIQQSFEALPNGSYLQFQQGELIQPGNLDRWQTYCRLYVYNPEQDAGYTTSIAPAVLRIRAVEVDYRSSDDPTRPYFSRLSWDVPDKPAYYVYRVGMRLESVDQPELRSLNCYRKWATPRAHKYPTLTEIRAALGNFARLQAPL